MSKAVVADKLDRRADSIAARWERRFLAVIAVEVSRDEALHRRELKLS
jgi:hypothetical protein